MDVSAMDGSLKSNRGPGGNSDGVSAAAVGAVAFMMFSHASSLSISPLTSKRALFETSSDVAVSATAAIRRFLSGIAGVIVVAMS